jgi:tetratricopeptide (TPR) repeat protein
MTNISIFEKRIIKHTEKNNLKKGIKEINLMDFHLKNSEISSDIVIRFLRISCNFFNHFKQYKNEIKYLTYLANMYLDVRAMQPVYRAISEAIELAHKNNCIKEIFDLHKLLLIACFVDEDLDGALDCYGYVKELSEYTGIVIDNNTLFNVGTVYLQKDMFDEAIEIFNKIVVIEDEVVQFNCKLNLSICFRKTGRLDESLCLLEEIGIRLEVEIDIDNLIEYQLVYAKSLIDNEDFCESIEHLKTAVEYIEKSMDSVFKLYYRRGVREKYIVRLERMLLSIPTEYMNEGILFILSFTRSNQTSDWLYILDWCDTFYGNETAQDEDIQCLKTAISDVAVNGAPFLYGMIEKYDDHHINIDAWRWDNLNEIIDRLVKKYNINSPLAQAKVDSIFVLFIDRIKNNSIIVSFLSLNKKLLVVHEGRFDLISIDEGLFEEYFSAVLKYKIGELGSSSFAKHVEKIQFEIYKLLEPSLEYIAHNNLDGLFYIPDRYNFFPVTSSVLKNKELTDKMIAEQFVIKTTPILFPKSSESFTPQFIKSLGVFELHGLELSESEIINSNNNLNINNASFLRPSNDSDEFIREMKDTDILHISSHGEAIDFFTDPTRAKLAEFHQIDTHTIQSSFYNLNYKLVLLNSCHSSSDLARKQISLFKEGSRLNQVTSYDTFSFPIILLLNRKSYTMSSSWKTFDKFAYILSHNLSKNLSISKNIEKSFSKSIATMATIDENSIEQNISSCAEMKSTLLQNKKGLIQMLQHPYSYATYQLYSLF